MLPVIVGVLIATGISFGISSVMIRMSKGKSLEEAQEQVASRKAEAKGQSTGNTTVVKAEGVRKVVFACDAGMGSSAMGATKFRNRVKANRPDLTVINSSVDTIPTDCDIAVVQVTLVERARKCVPHAQIVTINNFLADPALDALFEQLTSKEDVQQNKNLPKQKIEEIVSEVASSDDKKQILVRDGIKLNLKTVSKEEAIQAAGELLAELGYVDASYVDAMQEREKIVTTYMGLGVAIPHGTSQAKGTVKKTGIVLLQYPEGVSFGDEKAQLIFGIAGVGNEHLDLLEKICGMLEEEDILETFKMTADIDWILRQLN